MTRTLLLFDIDGTLLLTGGLGIGAMGSAGAKLFGDHFVLDGLNTSGMLDPVIFSQLALRYGIADTVGNHTAFRKTYLDELRSALDRHSDKVTVMPGIHRSLKELRQRSVAKGDVQLGLLSGNYPEAVPIKFAAAGLDPDWFPIQVLGDEADSRPELTCLAMRKYEAYSKQKSDPARVIVIGDTPKDVDCALAHGCVAFGVATGRYGIDELDAAGADVTVKDLSDPTPLYDLLD